MALAIEVKQLSKVFPCCKALDNVSLSIGNGEMVALIGASGSGKSTLLRHLSGFVKADEGEIRVQGQVIQQGGRIAPDIRKLRAEIRGFEYAQTAAVLLIIIVSVTLLDLASARIRQWAI